jgi:hypothetical protein
MRWLLRPICWMTQHKARQWDHMTKECKRCGLKKMDIFGSLFPTDKGWDR